ncbi:MAG: hypothetical protein ABSE08_01590 [Syntrophobacteraceae bacterium]
MKELLNHIYKFLATNDFPTMLAAIGELKWNQVARTWYTWLIILPVLIVLIWTKSIKSIVALVSIFLFLLLIQKTLSPAEGTLPLRDLLTFLAGAVALVGLNLYLIFIRE